MVSFVVGEMTGNSMPLLSEYPEVFRRGQWTALRTKVLKQKSGEIVIFGSSLYNLNPVSYTHLDVYKRQDIFKVLRIIEKSYFCASFKKCIESFL